MSKFWLKTLGVYEFGLVWFSRSYVAEVTPLMLHAKKEPARQQATEFLIVTK